MVADHSISAGWLIRRPIAHRGLHDRTAGRIENSLSAAKAAIARDFSIECDVQLSADGEAMVFHDFALDRLTEETGAFCDRSAAELTKIRLRDSADQIPTLPAYLAAIAGDVPLVIEIKSDFSGKLQLTRRVMEILKRTDAPVAVKSFDASVVAEIRRHAPELPRGIIGMDEAKYDEFPTLSRQQRHALANLLHFTETAPHFISWDVKSLPSAAPFLCRAALGLPLMTWTVRSPADRDIAAANADQMIFEGFLPQP